MLKIITITTGDIVFLKLQYLTLNKFINEPYEFLVINACVKKDDFSNFYNKDVYNNVTDFCKNHNLHFLNFMTDEEQLYYDNLQNATTRHAYILEKTVTYMKNNPDEYLNIDSDMFFIDNINMEEYRKYDCAIILQNNKDVKYIWGGLFYFNINKMKNLELLTDFNNGTYNNVLCDTGGGTSKWLNSLDDYKENIKYINHLCSCQWNNNQYPSNLNKMILDFCKNDFRNVNDYYYAEIYDNNLFHYRAGTNWNNFNNEAHIHLKDELFSVITELLS